MYEKNASAAAERVAKYLDERAKSKQLCQVEITGFHVGSEREAVLTVADLRALVEAASGVLPVQQPIDRPIDENALNDAAWMFIDNATGDIPVPLWNNLKLALRPAIECYLSKVATPAAAQQPAIPEGWKLVPIEPTAEIIAAAAIAVWPTALPRDMELGRKAAATVLMEMDLAPGATVESIGAHIATMAPAYRAMIAAAPVLLEDQKP